MRSRGRGRPREGKKKKITTYGKVTSGDDGKYQERGSMEKHDQHTALNNDNDERHNTMLQQQKHRICYFRVGIAWE